MENTKKIFFGNTGKKICSHLLPANNVAIGNTKDTEGKQGVNTKRKMEMKYFEITK